MKNFFYTLLQICAGLLVICVPLMSAGEYVCYAGLCGGPQADYIRSQTHFVTLFGLYVWLYPLLVLNSMYQAHLLRKTHLSAAVKTLFVPLICLLPWLYMTFSL